MALWVIRKAKLHQNHVGFLSCFFCFVFVIIPIIFRHYRENWEGSSCAQHAWRKKLAQHSCRGGMQQQDNNCQRGRWNNRTCLLALAIPLSFWKKVKKNLTAFTNLIYRYILSLELISSASIIIKHFITY